MGAVKIHNSGQSATITAAEDLDETGPAVVYTNAALTTPATLPYVLGNDTKVYLTNGDKRITFQVAGQDDPIVHRVQVQPSQQTLELPIVSTPIPFQLPKYPDGSVASLVPRPVLVDPRNHGAANDGVADLSVAVAVSLTEAALYGSTTLVLPAGTWRANTTVSSSLRGFTIKGERGDRPTYGGTSIEFHGSGPLFQLGSDNGHSADTADYDGPQGFHLSDIHLRAVGTSATTLADGIANGGGYYAGTYGIKDYRAGDVILDNVTFECFEYGFWGINSDFDRFTNLRALYCKTGFYIGPRSDQFLGLALSSTFCERAIHIEGSRNVTLIKPEVVQCGTSITNPVLIAPVTSSIAADGIDVIDPWLELDGSVSQQYTGSTTAWFEVGGTGDTATGTVRIINPFVSNAKKTSGSQNEVSHLVSVGNVTAPVVIENPTGPGLPNFATSFVKFVGSTSPSVTLRGAKETVGTYAGYTNSGTGSPNIHREVVEQGNPFRTYADPVLIQRNGLPTGLSASALTALGSYYSAIFANNGTPHHVAILSPATATGRLTFGHGSNAQLGWVGYDNNAAELHFGRAGANRAKLTSAGFALQDIGTGFLLKEGTNARMGLSTLVAGTVTVSNTSVTANTRIFITRQTTGGTVGHLSTTVSAGASFTINSSSNTETSTVAWILMEPS